MAKDNSLALCIVIIVIVGLFLHYEMGYNFELFNVGAKVKKYGNHNRHRWHHHFNPRHYNRKSYYVETHPHPQNITVSKKSLFGNYDLDNSGQIEEGEFYNAVEGDLGSKINDNNTYTFTA
jgi:hypothetical protein